MRVHYNVQFVVCPFLIESAGLAPARRFTNCAGTGNWERLCDLVDCSASTMLANDPTSIRCCSGAVADAGKHLTPRKHAVQDSMDRSAPTDVSDMYSHAHYRNHNRALQSVAYTTGTVLFFGPYCIPAGV